MKSNKKKIKKKKNKKNSEIGRTEREALTGVEALRYCGSISEELIA
jgi:hypothetical protein